MYDSTPSVHHPPAVFLGLLLMFQYSGAHTCFCEQGAVQCLRIVAAGFSGVVYGQIFSLGVSDALKKSLGFLVPGLALFCSAGCSLLGLAVSLTGKRVVGRMG